MESIASQSWFLSKHEDGSVFGPLAFEQVRLWAAAAQIAPHDKLSHDQQNWLKAPMIPELQMDWLVEVTSERYYGPTTLGTVQEFLRLGEIGEETYLINSCDGTRRQVRELADLLHLPDSPNDSEADEEPAAPTTTTMSIAMQERISGLEQSLRDERRALAECEARYRELEGRYRVLEQGPP